MKAWLKEYYKVIIALASLILIIFILVYVASKQRPYAMKVDGTHWRTIIQIQEYRACEHRSHSRPPKDAYDIRKHTDTKTVKDEDGKEHKEEEVTYYYKTNQWENSRQVAKAGTDKSPVYGEFTLQDEGKTVLGAERESTRYTEYHCSGIIDDESKDYQIPYDIWINLVPQQDWITFTKSLSDKEINNVVLCKNGDGAIK